MVIINNIDRMEEIIIQLGLLWYGMPLLITVASIVTLLQKDRWRPMYFFILAVQVISLLYGVFLCVAGMHQPMAFLVVTSVSMSLFSIGVLQVIYSKVFSMLVNTILLIGAISIPVLPVIAIMSGMNETAALFYVPMAYVLLVTLILVIRWFRKKDISLSLFLPFIAALVPVLGVLSGYNRYETMGIIGIVFYSIMAIATVVYGIREWRKI